MVGDAKEMTAGRSRRFTRQERHL